jgi:deoxyribose-phosphate aldolase
MYKSLKIPGLIDHTLLRPDATGADIKKLCEEAMHYSFHSVCIHPSFIKYAKDILSGSKVKISTVIGFPFGMTLSGVKVFEAAEAVREGADELDIVINIGLARSGRWSEVESEISDIVRSTPDSLHKIIIEACYLSDEEKREAAIAVINAGAEFIKTSTGFAHGGAELNDVRLIRSVTEGRIGIKAAGGIKSLKDLLAFVDAGATRIGTSSGVEIIKEAKI